MSGGGGRFRLPANRAKRWRWTLAQREGETFYEELEAMVDWSKLDEKLKKKKLPPGIDKLLTVYGPSKAALDDWAQEFEQGHDLRRINAENVDKANVQDVNMIEQEWNDAQDAMADLTRHDHLLPLIEETETTEIDNESEEIEIDKNIGYDTNGSETISSCT